MLVRCIDNKATCLPEHYRKVYAPKGCINRKWPIIINKVYIACAIAVYDGHLLYLVKIEDGLCPEFIPAPLFSVVNGRISTGWSYWAVKDFLKGNLESVFGYTELTDDSSHYDNLIDGDLDAIKLFQIREKEIRNELTD